MSIALLALPALVSVVYFLLKLETAGLSGTDENIYFYDVLLFTRGIMPYRDYFFAHPPLHVVLPGLLSLVVGFSLTVLKMVPIAASVLSGWAVFLGVRRHFGFLAGMVGMLSFLFAFEQLQASSNMTGINLTVMFVAWSFWAFAMNLPLASGVLAGLAVLTGVYAAPILAVLPLVLAWQGRTPLLRFLLAAGGTFVALTLVFWTLGGDAYIDQVYRYHFLKSPREEGWVAPMASDWKHLVFGWVALLAGILSRHRLSHWMVRLQELWSPKEKATHRGRKALKEKKRSSSGRATAGSSGASGASSASSPSGNPDSKPSSLRQPLPTWVLWTVGLCVLGTLFLLYYFVIQAAKPLGPALVLDNALVLVKSKEFMTFAYYHFDLIAGALLLPVAWGVYWAVQRLVGRGAVAAGQGWQLTVASLLACWLYFVELAMLKETYSFYYVLLILPGALATGCLFGWLWQTGRELVSWVRFVERPVSWRPWATASGVVVAMGLVVVMYFQWPSGAEAVGKARYPEEVAAAGEETCYPWRDSFPHPWSEWTKKWFWKECRIRGELESVIPRYLWNKKLYFSTAEEIGTYIREHSSEGDTIAGGSLTTPLLAILSGRDIAAQFVDTNNKRFRSGMITEEEFWKQVCATPLRFIVASPRTRFSPQAAGRHPVIRKYFRLDRRFDDPNMSHAGSIPIWLFRRIAEEPLEDGTWCGPKNIGRAE